MRAVAAVLAALPLALALSRGGLATAPVLPDASECQTVPQRSLVVLFATPVSATAMPAEATPAIPAAGPPADAATTEAVTATTRAVIACLNAGDYWSLVTLVSDNYLRRSFVEGAPADPLAVELAPFVNAVRGCQQCTIAPRKGEDRVAIVAIANARTLPDGRIGIDLMLASPSGANPARLVVAFVAVDDRWLVDEIVALNKEGTPAPS
jgi:ABC-type proline/glycine betaine transport system permease subunit